MLPGILAGLTNSAIADSNGEHLYFYHSDHLGTPLFLTDVSGTVVWRGEYLPFGEVFIEDRDPDGDGVEVEQPFRFPGQYEDVETGLYYNYFRDYDPGIGRYVQTDPFGLTFCENLYVYAHNSVINASDPLGLWTCPTDQGKRGKDKCGSGEWEAPRGEREHKGIDYCGSSAYAPIGGKAEKIRSGYNEGVRITGKDYVVIIQHINTDLKTSQVKEGDRIGTPKSAASICKDMKAHAHVQIYKLPNMQLVNPDDVINCE